MPRYYVLAALLILTASAAVAGPIAENAAKAERLIEEGKALEAVTAMDSAVEELWERMPLVVRNVQHVSEATAYGVFIPRENNIYKPGEKFHIYGELLGYKVSTDAIGNKAILIDLGVRFKNDAGKTLVTIDKGLSFSQPTRIFNKEFFLRVDLNFTGAPAGKYVAELSVLDRGSQKTTVLDVPFEIAE